MCRQSANFQFSAPFLQASTGSVSYYTALGIRSIDFPNSTVHGTFYPDPHVFARLTSFLFLSFS